MKTALRLLGAALLLGCGWCVGDAVQARADAHAGALRQVLRLLERVRQEIAYRRADLNLLYRRLVREGLVPGGADASLQTLAPPAALAAAEAACLAECLAGLGHAAAAQECERLEYYIARFKSFLQQAEARAAAQAALSRRLGLAAGAVLALLFL